jgi:delta24(24(1))-sterol reductase
MRSKPFPSLQDLCLTLSRWGFLVIFWNLAGVPFVSRSFDCVFRRSFAAVICVLCRLHGLTRPLQIPLLHPYICPYVLNSVDCVLYVRRALPLFSMTDTWIRWDTSMSQKSRFKMQTQGIFKFRYTFPQLPGGTIKNPTYIQTEHG